MRNDALRDGAHKGGTVGCAVLARTQRGLQMAEANGNATGHDVHEIKALIARQSASLTWSSGPTGNRGAFFIPDELLTVRAT